MKFADYFKEAIAYGESLGLRNGTIEAYADFYVELDDPKPMKLKGEVPFYPMFMTMQEDSGFSIPNLKLRSGISITVEQQLKLVKMFVSAYEKYLADKKEPVAADSNR
ncbi:MAG: hypothetical protein ABF690_00485 [Liquorilactobacillus nagelii]|uniref:hypothetical protein n=1 Tax=Oenococcus sicerae TaxID=2203724 RepID=UPI0039E998A0